MKLPDFFFFFCFGGVGSSCPRVCVPVQLNIFMLPCVLLEGNLTVCVAFVFFVCLFFFLSFRMKPPSKKLQMDENGGLLVHIECCD